MNMRRVVTGHPPEGKSIVASDSVVDPIRLETLPGNEFHLLWVGDDVRGGESRRGRAVCYAYI